jgi:copper transport protein
LLGLLLPAGRRPRRARLLVWAGFAALALGTVAALLAQFPYSTGGAMTSAFSADALRTTLSTAVGKASLARLGILAVLAVAVTFLVRGRADAARPPLAVQVAGGACLLALPLTWTLADHSRAGQQVWLAVPVASVHLLAVAIWLGGLVLLAACAVGADLGAERLRATALALPRFSRLALPCFTVIVLTGLYQTWRQVGTLPALSATEFGRLLLVKLGGVVLIVVLAWQARRFVQRQLTRTAVSAHAWRLMRRSLGVEALLGVAVLAVATVMVNTAPARTSYAPPVRAEIGIPVADSHSPLNGGHVEVRLTPAKQGLNIADIYLVARDGSLVSVPEVSAQLAAARRGSPAEQIKVSAAEPGHYVASTVSIPYAGKWLLQLYVRTTEFDETPVLVRFRAH